MQLNNVSIYTNDGEFIERGYVTIEGDEIVAVGAGESRYEGENLDFAGSLVMPSFVNAHTHIYSTLSRGMRLSPFNPGSFTELLEQLWWRLDRSLTLEELKISGYVAAIESLKSGVTTLFDHSASPNAISGSLETIAGSVNETGLRYCGAYEVSDRDGTKARDEGIKENMEFSRFNTPFRRGFFGLHASLTLSRETLSLVSKEISGSIPIHVHIAEGPEDQERSLSLFDQRVLERFHRSGLMSPGSIYAHCIHTTPEERELIPGTGGSIAVNVQSNTNNGVGLPDWKGFLREGVETAIGNDGYGFNLCHDVRFALLTPHYLSRDSRVSGSPDLKDTLFGANYRLATRTFGANLGTVREGSAADLVVIDYRSPTPVDAGNFLDHYFFGICDNIKVTDAFVSGRHVLSGGRATLVDEEAIYSEARRLSANIWKRI
ncbi:MAG: amidohydrolase family protein [Mesotoga sp.]